MRVVLLGPPGAGKGTQAKLVQERLGVPHISTGDLLRAAVQRRSALGQAAERYMNRGELVPNDLVVQMIAERIQELDCRDGFLLDGFPRNVAQAEVLERMLASQRVRLDSVISIRVPADELIRRLSGRRTCRSCGAMYHVDFNPPVSAGRCDRCDGELIQRDDDREQTVRARLSVYQRETAPLEEYYQNRSLLRLIDGTGSPESVRARLLAFVDGKP
jgi:adenylate kinase